MVWSKWSRPLVGLLVLLLLSASHLTLGPTPAGAAPTIGSFTASLVTAPNGVRLSWTSSGATQAYIFGTTDAAGLSPIGFVPVNGTKDVTTGWGTARYTLGVKDAGGVWRYRSVDTAALNINAPTVTITSTNPKVIDYFRSPTITSPLPNHTITWNANGASVVKLRACGPNGCTDLGPVAGGSYTVTGASLASVNADGTFSGLLAPSGQGEVVYELTGCVTATFCGESVKAPVRVLPAQTTSTFREYRNHPVYLGHTITWSANGGNWFYVDAPTLGVNNALTTATSFAFTAAQLNNAGPGLHTIKVKACKWYGGPTIDCAVQHAVKAGSAGTVSGLVAVGTDLFPTTSIWPTPVATVNGQPQVSTRGGKAVSTCGCEGQSVAAGTVLALVETWDFAMVQLQLGGAQTWTTKPWTQDFNASQSSAIQANQELHPGGVFTANGASILPNGDIYALGEFTTSAIAISGGTVATRPLPFLHKLHPNGQTFEAVRPFGNTFFGGLQSNVSNSQDSVKDSAGKIWSTQGWSGGRLEVQQVTVDATSGSWKLSFTGQTTADLPSEATAAAVQAQLEALTNIEPGEVAVTGAAGGPYTVTFQARLAANVDQLVAQNVSLAGGTATASVTTTQNGLYNHSRIYRYDPTGTDSDLTVQDDRFCAYNVPGNNNDVMGVTTGGGKTWFMESGWSGLSPARLTWFNPAESAFTNCAAQNTFDFGSAGSPVALPPGPTFSPGYCVAPATTNCFNTVTVPAALGAPGHLVFDAAENAIWTSTYTWGGPASLGRYDIASGQWSVYPLPQSARPLQPWFPVAWGGSSTWEISLAGNHVYLNDQNDGDIIRFDKTYAPRTNCTALRHEVQWVTVDATSGTWTLSFLGQVTAAIDSEATAATVQARLEALPNLDPGDVTVTGAPGGRYTIVFEGQHAAKDVGQLIATNVSLAGGAATASVTTPQPGGQNLCMSEVHLPASSTWQSIARGSKLYFTAAGPAGGGASGGLSREPYLNDSTRFGYVDLSNWGAITTYTGLETLVAPGRADVGGPAMSWFDVDQASGKIAIGQPYRGQFLRLVP